MKIALIGQKGIFSKKAAGGIESHVENLALRLKKRGHDVDVYVRPHFMTIHAKKHQGLRLIFIRSIPTKNLDTITYTFLATMRALFVKYDIIHYHGVGPSTLAWIPRVLKWRTKVVTTFHSQDKFHKKWSWFARKYLAWGEWTACKFPHATIAVSQTIQKFCKKEFNAKVNYIPNGVILPPKQGKDRLHKWDLEPRGYLLTVARLVRHKGIHHLISAYKRIEDKVNKKLIIVGAPSFTDDYLEYLKSIAAQSPNIIFTGFQTGKTLSQLFANAYLYVHPSEFEGLSITILEAMSYGKGVLISDIPENMEAIDHSGYWFKNKSVKALEEKLLKLIKNPLMVHSAEKRARKFIANHFEWESVVDRTEKLYKKLRKEEQE